MSSIVDTIFGAALIGIMLSAIIFGILTSQIYSYFMKYPTDKLWMKLLVAGLWVLEAFQVAATMHMIYTYLVKDFGQIDKLAIVSWDWVMYIGVTSTTATAVQTFFAYRVFTLTKQRASRWLVTATIMILSLVQFAIGFAILAECYKLHLFLDFTKITWGFDTWLGCACVCDLTIVAAMCYFLHTSRTGIKKTDRLINKLMAYAIQTGGITSLVEIICLATFTEGGWHYGHVLVIFPLGGFYCTSLLANLHARQSSVNLLPVSSSGAEMGRASRATNRKGGAISLTAVSYTASTTLQDDSGKRLHSTYGEITSDGSVGDV